MNNFESQLIESFSNDLVLSAAKGIVFVFGLGGAGIRPQTHRSSANPGWASVYTSDVYIRVGEMTYWLTGLSSNPGP